MPAKVDELFDEVKKSNPSYSDEQAWATAWSIACKNGLVGKEHCHQPTSEYLKGKTAASAAYEQALAKHTKALKEYEAAVAAYRAGRSDDDKFLAARAEMMKADKMFDQAFEAEAAREEAAGEEDPHPELDPQMRLFAAWAVRAMLSGKELHDRWKKAEGGFAAVLQKASGKPWKLKKMDGPTEHGEVSLTWESEGLGTFTLYGASVSPKMVEVRLHYLDPKGMPEQPKVTKVQNEKVDDPSVLSKLLAQYKKKVEWLKSAQERIVDRYAAMSNKDLEKAIRASEVMLADLERNKKALPEEAYKSYRSAIERNIAKYKSQMTDEG